MMDYQKKLDFVHKQTKLALEHVQHMDEGGTILGGPSVTTGPTAQTTAGSVSPFSGVTNEFQATGAPIQAGTNAGQLNTAYSGAQSGIGNQGTIVGQTAPGVAQGIGTEATLSNELANESAGVGPNPAQAALAEATRRNVATTGSQMAGARGASGNVGLMARQIGQQGAATQEQAAGEAATTEAQQQLAAENARANLAATQVGQGTGAVTSYNQEQQNEQNILQGANTAGNNANVAMQGNINNVNATVAAANQQSSEASLGGTLSGATSLFSTMMFAKGGLVKMDSGGNVLDAEARSKIAPHNFALPGGRYPIHDANHARNALARVSQYGTPEEKKKVKAAVHKKYPDIGKKMADGGDVSPPDANPTPAPEPSPANDISKSFTSSTGTQGIKQAMGNLSNAVKSYDEGGEVDFQPTSTDSDASSPSPDIAGAPATPEKKKGGSPLAAIGAIAALAAYGGEMKHGYLKAVHAAYGYVPPQPLSVAPGGAPQSFAGQWLSSPAQSGSAPVIAAAAAAPQQQKSSGSAEKIGSTLAKFFQKPSSSGPSSAPPPVGDVNADLYGAPGTRNDQGQPTNQATYDVYQSLPDAPASEYKGGLAAKGGNVKAKGTSQKAVVSGDSLKNDKIPAELSEGEVVIDRDTLSDKGPVGQMARAVAAHIEKRNKGRK